MVIAAMIITAQFSNVLGQEQETKAKKLERAVGQGTGVLDVKDEKGVIRYVSVVGQVRISTVLGLSKGIIVAKRRASLLADAAFTDWMKSEVESVVTSDEKTVLMLEGAEGPEVDELKEEGKSETIDTQNVKRISRGIIRGMVTAAYDQDGKAKLYTIVKVWNPKTGLAAAKAEKQNTNPKGPKKPTKPKTVVEGKGKGKGKGNKPSKTIPSKKGFGGIDF
jgi:hypothetical protein